MYSFDLQKGANRCARGTFYSCHFLLVISWRSLFSCSTTGSVVGGTADWQAGSPDGKKFQSAIWAYGPVAQLLEIQLAKYLHGNGGVATCAPSKSSSARHCISALAQHGRASTLPFVRSIDNS